MKSDLRKEKFEKKEPSKKKKSKFNIELIDNIFEIIDAIFEVIEFIFEMIFD